jgi:hypothetical protein
MGGTKSALKKILAVTLIIIFFSCLGTGIYLNYYYAYNRPLVPQPELGREYSLHVHKTTVYLTEKESSQIDWLFIIMILSGLGGGALYVVIRRSEET